LVCTYVNHNPILAILIDLFVDLYCEKMQRLQVWFLQNIFQRELKRSDIAFMVILRGIQTSSVLLVKSSVFYYEFTEVPFRGRGLCGVKR
jgi:hypothetical protein